MELPNLKGVIDAKDVQTKPTGFKAKYMAWAKIAQLLHDHAPGWQFHLNSPARLEEKENGVYEECPNGHVFKAPDGTGYLSCFFRHTDGTTTSYFPFPVMDNRNNPVAFERISARVFTDSHRRALCAAAAFHFSLGYELWANEEIEENNAEESVNVQPECQLKPPAPTKKEEPKKKSLDKQDLIDEVVGFIQTKFDTQEKQINWVAEKATEYDLTADGSKLAQMTIIQLKECIKELKKL